MILAAVAVLTVIVVGSQYVWYSLFITALQGGTKGAVATIIFGGLLGLVVLWIKLAWFPYRTHKKGTIVAIIVCALILLALLIRYTLLADMYNAANRV